MMDETKSNILIIEDDEAILFAYKNYLMKMGYTVTTTTTLQGACSVVKTVLCDVILLDLKLPDGNALNWISKQTVALPNVPIIVITGIGDIPTAVQATKNGAHNFLTKPVEMDVLIAAIENGVEQYRIGKKINTHNHLPNKKDICFGTSRAITDTLELAKIATSNQSVVLLQGETGTGKGVLANWIHSHSERKSDLFVELNCATLKGELLRSELFGHIKGAFTSANKNREGLIETAHKGTLFLDEIGDMDLEAQGQLLKTIEEKLFRRIGENKTRTSDFRLICATNKDIIQQIKEEKFRSDLYYRIFVFPIALPPLRKRTGDIPLLSSHFLKSFGYIKLPLSEDVMYQLMTYRWPGNVRELRNVLERAYLISQGQTLKPIHFDKIFSHAEPYQTHYDNIENLRDLTRVHILSVVQKSRGDLKIASKTLGMSMSNLYRRLKLINKQNSTDIL